MSTISKSSLNQPWSEDVCWVGKNVLAVASAHKENVPINHQLTLVHVEKGRAPRASLGQAGPSISWKVQNLSATPHDKSKGIQCISSISDDADGMSLVTAGFDKQIVGVQILVQARKAAKGVGSI